MINPSENSPDLTAMEERILILAPVGRDAALTANVLEQAGLVAVICSNLPDLLEKVAAGAGALLLTEEMLALPASNQLKTMLSAQPSWSNLPIILLAGSRQRVVDRIQIESYLKSNITLLQRPITVTSLVTVAQTALRARRRQYETRDLLAQLNDKNERLALEIAERKQAQAELKRLADTLEQRVARRTQALVATNKALSRQIIERQKTEMALAEERNLLRTLIDAAPAYILVKDLNNRFMLGNSQVMRMLGIKDETEFLKKTHFDFFPQEIAARYYNDDQTVMKSGQPITEKEELVVTPAGNRFWVSTTKVPLYDEQGAVMGILGIGWDITKRKEMEQEQAKLMIEISWHHEQLRSLSARLADVQEKERQHLVRELHDQVGQSLTALNFNLGFVHSQLPDNLPKGNVIQARLAQAIDLVAETTDRIRNVMAELRPPLLDESGLFDALEWYASRFENWSGLPVIFTGETVTPRPAAATENALFRIAQEALNNVAKHAQATQIQLSLQADDQTMYLTITDDGCGFDTAILTKRGNNLGWGMRTMVERAEMVYGMCQVESRPGQGTRVMIKVPRTRQDENK